MPVVVAPTAYQEVAHAEGEVETAKGVTAASGLMVVTTRATRALEEITAELGAPGGIRCTWSGTAVSPRTWCVVPPALVRRHWC